MIGQPAWRVYVVEEQEFDGFDRLGLKEAKGPGYESFFNEDGTPKKWYVRSGKFDELLAQAKEQSRIARVVGLPLIWYVAEARVAEFLGKIFKRTPDIQLELRHLPPSR